MCEEKPQRTLRFDPKTEEECSAGDETTQQDLEVPHPDFADEHTKLTKELRAAEKGSSGPPWNPFIK